MTHLVNTLRLEISCDSEDIAFALRHQLAPSLQQQVSAALEKAAAKIVLPGEWLQAERIEIDLGNISLDTPDFIISAEIESQLLLQLQQAGNVAAANEQPGNNSINNAELFSYFMETGSLPWWAQALQPDMNGVLLTLSRENRKWLVSYLYEKQQAADFWKRMSFQINKEQKKLVLGLTDEFVKALKGLQEIIDKGKLVFIKNDSNTGNEIAAVDDKEVYRTIDENELVDIVLREAPKVFASFRANSLDTQLLTIARQYRLVSFAAIENSGNKLPAELKITDDKTWSLPENTKKKSLSGQAETDDNTITVAENDTQNEAPEKYFIRHAGIILLAPFLNPFFKTLQLTEGGQWKNPASAHKAVHLLRYLACGDRGVAEYNLVLEKIICGLSPAAPVPIDVQLELGDIAEADTLLKDIIGHWKAIKNTSVTGLRKTFLQRDGIISVKENGWLLQVERKTEDVLLDMMPWGYSVVQFSWVEKTIYTEW
jgi:Contractile injection system tape measure protein